MMIKRYGTIDLTEWYIKLSDFTDNHRNEYNSIPVYFDAAFSRKVVNERVIDGAYTMVKELITKGVLVPEEKTMILIYDPETISQENGYKSIMEYMNSNKDLVVCKGVCECAYDSKDATITTTIKTKEKIS